MPRTQGARTRVAKRRTRTRDRVWASMRMLRTFSIPDLMATSDAGYDNVKKYVRGLERAGYLRRIADHTGRKGQHARWILIRDTGHIAPRLCSDGTTYDANTARTHDGGIKQ